MEEQQVYAREEAAKNFSDALAAAYKTVTRADRVSQQPDPELTGRFCDLVTSYLQAQAAPAEMPERETIESVVSYESVPSVDAYVSFLNSIVAHFRETDPRIPLVSVQQGKQY